MTALEKLEKEHPEQIIVAQDGNIGTKACPWHYNYLSPIKECGELIANACHKCWDREIPEEKENKTMPMTPNVKIVTDEDTCDINYKAEYERLKKVLDEQQDYKHQVEAMQTTIDKYEAIIRCVEAFVGNKIL